MSIKQAIEALEGLIDEKADYMRRNKLGDAYREHATKQGMAAIAALRSMPAEPVNDALNTLCKMLHSGEEVEGDDGLAMLVPMGLWNEAQEAIESLVGEDDTTPPPAPVLSDAEIDAITLQQWGDRVLLAAYRAYARAIEQSVIARGVGRGGM